MLLFDLDAGRELGGNVAQHLGLRLAPHEDRTFEDGEHKIRPLASVRGEDAFILHGLHGLHGAPGGSANDRLVRMLFFIATLRDCGAARVTALIPYLAYARKDRRTKPRDPVSLRYLAQLLEAVGTDAVAVLEPHNIAAYQNAFRIRAETLHARSALLDAVAPELGDGPLVVASPDTGGIARAELFREAAERRLARPVGRAFMEKRRSGGAVSGDTLVGEVSGSTVVLFDDLVSTGSTIVRAARACISRGAGRVVACATHGLFTQGAEAALADDAVARWVVSDTVTGVAAYAAAHGGRIVVAPVAPLLAEVVRSLAGDASLVDLLDKGR